MADSDDLDLDDGDPSDSGGSSKKRGGGGLGGLLPNILKFAAIGIGALIFIVTVSVITYNVMNKGGKQQTVIADFGSPYVGTLPQLSYYENIPAITIRTRDFPISSTVTVEILIGYDLNDQAASAELTSRRHEIHEFLRRYFTMKTVIELGPEREEEIKKEIREQLNTRFLDTARARNILIRRLDIMDGY